MKTQTHTLVSPAVLAAVFTLAALLAMAGQGVAQEAPTGDPTEDDPVLKFAKDNPFDGINFGDDCASVLDGGETLDGAGVDALPVGGGRRLECRIAVPQLLTKFVRDSTNTPWCQLGQLNGFVTRALDTRLNVTVESTPPSDPWDVVATHDGEEIEIIRATGSWPLAVEGKYATIDLQPALGRTCEQVFGL